jgi:hypothetical protein
MFAPPPQNPSLDYQTMLSEMSALALSSENSRWPSPVQITNKSNVQLLRFPGDHIVSLSVLHKTEMHVLNIAPAGHPISHAQYPF